ncbi:hypothetical protein ABZ671_16900 [Micromonospora sp. NPDC006766]|uniref:hypothetical protein n=1 Tax=Micromonospora sp. NPDC006766 TaxID=3154778 RepID=UPI0033DD07F1
MRGQEEGTSDGGEAVLASVPAAVQAVAVLCWAAAGTAVGAAMALVLAWGASASPSAMVVDVTVVVVLVGLSVAAASAALSTPQTGYVAATRSTAVGLAAAGVVLALATGGLPVAIRLTAGAGLAAHGFALLWLLGRKPARSWLSQRRVASARGAQRELWDLARAPWF